MGWLVPVGVVLILLGIGGSVGACYQATSDRRDPVSVGPGGDAPAEADDTSVVPMILAPASGLALALGVACIGVGMGRWQRPKPSDVRPANPWSEQPVEKGDPPVGLV
jgi:hypothetical protein